MGKALKRKIRIAHWKQITLPYLPLYVADFEGFFRSRGIQVEIDPIGNDDEIFREVISKKASFGIGDPTFCARLEFADSPTQVVASIVDRVALWGLSPNPLIKPITFVEDLVGLRVACFPRPSTTYSVVASVKAENKRLLRSLRILEGEIGKLSKLIEEGRCDVIIDYEPYVSQAEENGYSVVYSLPDFHGSMAMTGLYCLLETIEDHPNVVTQIVGGIEDALDLISQSTETALKISRKLFPNFSKDVLKRAISRLQMERVWRKDARTTESSWLEAIRIRKNIGERFIRRPFSVVNNSFSRAEESTQDKRTEAKPLSAS